MKNDLLKVSIRGNSIYLSLVRESGEVESVGFDNRSIGSPTRQDEIRVLSEELLHAVNQKTILSLDAKTIG